MEPRDGIEGSPDHAPTGIVLSEQLAHYLKVLRRRWLMIALVPAWAVAVSLAIALGAHKQYDATAKLVLNSSNQVTALLNPGAAGSSADPERDLNTEVSLIKTVPLAERVRRQLRLAESDQDLLDEVTPSLEGTTNIVNLKVRDPHPARAAALANAFANQYVAMRQRDARTAFRQAATRARNELRSLSPAQRRSPSGLQLQARLHELDVDGLLQPGNAKVIQRAATPTSASSPRLLFDSVLAAMLGLVLGVVAVGLLELLDRRVKDEDDVSVISRLPSLASIPQVRRALRSRPLELSREQIEGYRSLATNLRFFKLGGTVKSLMITSPSPLSGKTSVTLALAGALAEFGQEVIAVECDLRRPRFAEYLELPQRPGLSSILAGLASWQEQIVEIAVDQRVGESARRSGSPHFSVLPGGATPPNPQALLSSPEMSQLLLDLRSSADVVLIDTPPLGTFTDAVPLIPWVDGVALVVRLKNTTRDALKKTCNLLAELDAPVLGTVLTGTARRPLSAYREAREAHPPRLPEGAPSSQA